MKEFSIFFSFLHYFRTFFIGFFFLFFSLILMTISTLMRTLKGQRITRKAREGVKIQKREIFECGGGGFSGDLEKDGLRSNKRNVCQCVCCILILLAIQIGRDRSDVGKLSNCHHSLPTKNRRFYVKVIIKKEVVLSSF